MTVAPLHIETVSLLTGFPGREGIRVTTHEATMELLDVFQKHGHDEVDTARVYGGGTSEEYLGAVDWQKRGIKMETKFYPNRNQSQNQKSPSLLWP